MEDIENNLKSKKKVNKRKIGIGIVVAIMISVSLGAVIYSKSHKTKSLSRAQSKKLSSEKSPTSKNSPQTANLVSRLDRFDKEKITFRINDAVETKKITNAQAKKITDKLNEFEKFVAVTKTKNADEQSKALQDSRKNLTQWARDNNIPIRYVSGWI